MTRELFRAHNLESLKKEAKRWLAALRAHDPQARKRLDSAVPDATRTPTLRDVQHALARELGLDGWAALKQAVEQTLAASREDAANALARYEDMADALLQAYRTGTPEAMERHYRLTWHRRSWNGMRRYVQADLGKPPGDDTEITLDDARYLVALEHGFRDWADLRRFTESGKAGARVAAKPMLLIVHEGQGESRTLARSRVWDEIIRLLALNPSVTLHAQRQMTDDMLAELSRIGTITTLDLSGCKGVTDEGMRHLAKLQTLQHLNLSETSITDAGLRALSSLAGLQSIELSGTCISDDGVKALAHCDELQGLDLSGTRAGDGALGALAGKPKLSHLAITLSDAGLALLHELPRFKTWHGGEARLSLMTEPKSLPNHLSLWGSFTDMGMRHLRGLDGLFALNIDDRHLAITAAGVAPLASLPHLGVLGVIAKDDWMPQIAAIPHLRCLIAQDTIAGDEGFVALSQSRSLEYLWGGDCHNLRRRGFLALAQMPTLRGLSVSCLNVDNAGVSALPEFPVLKELMPMGVPDTGYRHVGRCQHLESLILMYCRDATDTATEHIARLRKLSYYFNSYTSITDRTPELLSTMDSLEKIEFYMCHGVTNAGVSRFARLPKLRELRVSGNQLTPEVGAAFPSRINVITDAWP